MMKYCVPKEQFIIVPEVYRIGTLSYTKLSLCLLFAILYIGVFAMSGAVLVVPNLVPIFLGQMKLSNAIIGILIGSIPSLLNVVINPFASVSSDQTRTRLGRRTPFMLVGVPGVGITLILMGGFIKYTPDLVKHFIGILTSDQVTVIIMAFLMVSFQVFSNLGLSIFYYFCTDVIPGKLIGRFMSIFMLFSSAGGFCFSYLMMPLAESNMPLVFIIQGSFLLLAFSLIFLLVKEGQYPEPVKRKNILKETIRFFCECFGSKFYVFVFLGFAVNDVSTLCRGFFSALYARELGMNLAEYGKILSICAIICAALTIPIGLVIDRLKPLRLYIIGAFLIVINNFWGFFFALDKRMFTVVILGNAVVYTLQMASQLPSYVALFPRDRYGQFSAANAIFATAITAVFSYLGGAFIDLMGHYRYMFLWDACFTSVGLIILIYVYQEWQRK